MHNVLYYIYVLYFKTVFKCLLLYKYIVTVQHYQVLFQMTVI